MYVVERWLARMSRSDYAEDFVLKGGMLLAALGSRRPTVDADALARNMSAEQPQVASRVAEIAALVDPEDGVEFLVDSVKTSTIRDDALYAGVRVVLAARIGTATVKLRLDINFGDPVTPQPQLVELPALRPGVPPVRLLGYPIATVLAEKLATAIDLGAASTRVRDWADIYTVTGAHAVDLRLMREALRTTAAFRGTTLTPLATAIGRLVELRGPEYHAYRASLGYAGQHLPEQLDRVVDAAVTFTDPLLDDLDPERHWSPQERAWVSPATR